MTGLVWAAVAHVTIRATPRQTEGPVALRLVQGRWCLAEPRGCLAPGLLADGPFALES
jgi:hypothetical protein